MQGHYVQLDPTRGSATIIYASIDNGSSDNVDIASMEVSIFRAKMLEATWLVTLTIQDTNPNTAECTSLVMVEDKTAPTAQYKDITVQLDVTSGFATINAFQLDTTRLITATFRALCLSIGFHL